MLIFTVSASKPVGTSIFKNAIQNAYQMIQLTPVKNEQRRTCRQSLHSVVDGMSRLFCAAVKLLHLNGLNFAVLLQIKDLKVPREKGDDVGRGVHCMSKVCEAFDRNNNMLSNSKNLSPSV